MCSASSGQVLVVGVVLTLGFGGFCTSCDADLPLFQGFGIFLGSVNHFKDSPPTTANRVVDRVYTDLGIRYFRTSYEPEFSLANHTYSISCATSNYSCAYIQLLNAIRVYNDTSVFASIWSPPHYMKHPIFDSLLEEYELDYYYFIKNVTAIIKEQFRGLEIERVSPINEPENVFATWDHTNMPPFQLCRMIQKMNDPLVSLCPENAYYWMTELYSNYSDKPSGVSCSGACEILATHAYTLDIDFWSPFRLLASYDLGRYERHTRKAIWLTEVSSTYPLLPTIPNQMQEALDLSSSIVNFVGTTCVQRYYFWQMYTRGASGESLIWGPLNSHQNENVTLYNSKKYYAYRHFTRAAFGGPKYIDTCDISSHNFRNNLKEGGPLYCLKLRSSSTGDNTTTAVFVNTKSHHYRLHGALCATMLCCTSAEFDWNCVNGREILLPKRAICSCKLAPSRSGISGITVTESVFDNEV